MEKQLFFLSKKWKQSRTIIIVCIYNSLSYLVQSSSIPEPGYVWQLSKSTFGLISAAACVCVAAADVCWLLITCVSPAGRNDTRFWEAAYTRRKAKRLNASNATVAFSYVPHPDPVLSRSHNAPSSALTFLTLSPFLLPFLFIWVSHTHIHTHFSPLVTPGRKHIKAVNSEIFHIFLAALNIWQCGWTEKLGTVSVQTVQIH